MINEAKKSWIEDLYQRSWEMELLISGFVLVLLFQAYGQLNTIGNWAYFTIAGELPRLIASAIMGLALHTTIIILCIFFSLNLAARAYWVALIGLMSRQDKALKTRTFSQHSKQNSIQQKQVSGFEAHLDKVDEIGSQLFGAGLLVACHIMSLLAALTLVMVGLHALSFVEDIHPALALIGAAIFFIHFLCLYIFLLDTFSNGLLSKRKSGIVNKPMYLIYRVQRLLNGYFLYEKIHLRLRNTKITLLSNLFFLILIVGFVVYLIVAVVEGFNHAQNSHHEQNTVTQEEVEQDNFFRTFYLSNYQQNGLISAISLSQPEYSNMPVKLFIPLFAQMQSMIDGHCEANAFAEPEDEVNLPCIQDFFTIQVNGNELDVEAIAGRHADSRTKGINYYIDLPELARGKHEITVVIDNPDFKEADETEEREPEHLETQLDFWYFPTK